MIWRWTLDGDRLGAPEDQYHWIPADNTARYGTTLDNDFAYNQEGVGCGYLPDCGEGEGRWPPHCSSAIMNDFARKDKGKV